MNMTATLWLLLSICCTLSVLWLVVAICRAADKVEEELFRTADWWLIDSDTRKLQAQVPNVQPWSARRTAGGACTGNCNQGRACTCEPTKPRRAA